MASLALMLMTAWLMSQGKPYGWTFYPMIFMFITTIAALVVTSYRLFTAVFTGAVKGEELDREYIDGFGCDIPGHCRNYSGSGRVEGFWSL